MNRIWILSFKLLESTRLGKTLAYICCWQMPAWLFVFRIGFIQNSSEKWMRLCVCLKALQRTQNTLSSLQKMLFARWVKIIGVRKMHKKNASISAQGHFFEEVLSTDMVEFGHDPSFPSTFKIFPPHSRKELAHDVFLGYFLVS